MRTRVAAELEKEKFEIEAKTKVAYLEKHKSIEMKKSGRERRAAALTYCRTPLNV